MRLTSYPRFLAILSSISIMVAGAEAQTVIRLPGSDFVGGGKDKFGASQKGEQTNYVYAHPTGAYSVMQASFSLKVVPAEPMFLHLKACDDDSASKCRIRVTLNGKSLWDGPSEFRNDAFEVRRIAISAGVLKAGENELVIANTEPKGELGMPPWFMVAACTVAPEKYTYGPDITKDFTVTLPAQKRPLPEPLPDGRKPGFAIRGTKGWGWFPQQYLAEISTLAACKMNFLMNCYLSMCDIEHYPWGDKRCNRWWEPLPEAKKKAYERIVRECQKTGIDFCFSMNPNLGAERILDYGKAEDVDLLWKHYRWMQELGVKWFNIALDDISEGIDASGQARVANEFLKRLRAGNPDAQLIVCPTWYWGDGTDARYRPYLETFARELDEDIYLFWTGDAVVINRITRKCAETYKGIVKHRLILWDNYPVNDNAPTMHLGPVFGRDPDLCEVIDGYMSNPLCKQNEINRIPLMTCADYAYNPWAYDPARSVGQAILHFTDDATQRVLVKDLVEAYPGMLYYGKGTGFNAVREQYARIAAVPHSRYIASMYIDHVQSLARRVEDAFPDRLKAERQTVVDDITWMKRAFAEKYGTEKAE